MKKTLGVLVAGLATAVAFASVDNVVVSFSTPGPDKYADGTQVLDGECYALVYTPKGSAFAGINADGTAAGDSRVMLTAPVAKGGKCPNIMFQVDGDYVSANDLEDGLWGVYVLDTRKFSKDETKGTETVVGVGALDADGTASIVNGYGATSAAGTGVIISTGTTGAVAVQAKSEVPNAGKDLTIQHMEVKTDGNVYITVKGALSCMQYAISSGDKPGNIEADAASTTAYGDANGEAILIAPAKGGSQFFQVNRK